MKLLVIGLGQCGNRIADSFTKLNKRARSKRGPNIIVDAFAVNTDVADLTGLFTIKSDCDHRIAIGGQKTNGHGVGKVSELGAEIFKEDGDRVIQAIRKTQGFSDTDAFLLIAGASGGTGSGGIAPLTRHLKERYIGKPVYNLLVLPFQQEEMTEARTVYNTAVCLKSTYLVADAVFLVDNQRYVKKTSSVMRNMIDINERIAEPFYNLLCAGEEANPKYVGAKVLDAGDIIQTLVGWTAIGEGRSPITRNVFQSPKNRNFRDKVKETGKGMRAMHEAVGELSLTCDPVQAKRALFLLSAPHREINMGLMKEVGDNLKALAPNALIRSGDYPRQRGYLDISLILSELTSVRKITNYFSKAIELISLVKARQGKLEYSERKLADIFDDIPMLI